MKKGSAFYHRDNKGDYACSDRDWCIFIRDRRWSSSQKHRLLERFKTPEAVYSASVQDIFDCVAAKQSLTYSKVPLEVIRADLRWLGEPEHHLIHWHDGRYPVALKQLPDPPVALFAVGDVSQLIRPQLAIVGSRRPTPVGAALAERIAGGLAELGVVVTSGLALGIDSHAHLGALNAGGESTAVLGSGLDKFTPVRNKALFDRLSATGLVLSEYPLAHPATRYTFPERNRIVSGLSLGVVIVEAAERSGTLITARLAAEQNREVMVVPGSGLSPQYRGSHALIQQGAALVTNVDDVLHCLAIELSARTSAGSQDDIAQRSQSGDARILRYIGAESTSMDDIILASGLTSAEVSSMLISLEIEGVVAVSGDGGYINLS